MKQLWLSVLLLTVLLAAGLFSAFCVRWVQEPISSQLEQAAQAGFLENWEEAERLFHAAQARWETYRNALASITDHRPMEEIDSLFGELESYQKARDPVEFSSLCQRLSLLTRAVGEAHSLSWWNLL